jgi:phosphate:Na+ symporter
VLLGSNLGTTLNTWILSSLGFRFDVDLIALPVIGLAGVFRALLKNRVVIFNVFSCLLGLGFIMMGLELIKTGMGGYLGSVDLSTLNEYSVVVGLLFGILITALIQSSAATLVIVLSALHADIINLYLATAVVLGAEIGTTLKFLFVSYNRESTMKRLALGNFLFNLLNAIVVLALLIPINKLITGILSISDPLYAIAFFQTLVNLLAIILFGPFLTFWESFLMKRFLNEVRVTKYIGGSVFSENGVTICGPYNRL